MADNLDDFFAKKDKTKKNKKKGLSNNDFVQKLESVKAIEKVKDKKISCNLNNLENFIQDDGEWKDFEDEDNKDYSGLKIQALSIKDKEEEQQEEEEAAKLKEPIDNPWKDKGEEEKSSASTTQVKPEEPKQENDIQTLFMAARASRGPRIDDAVEFPDLGTTREAYEELKTFQTVRSGGPSRIAPSNSAASTISTGNKYSALLNNLN